MITRGLAFLFPQCPKVLSNTPSVRSDESIRLKVAPVLHFQE